MKFKIVQGKNRFRIVNEDSYGVFWLVDNNLHDDELTITSLLSKECPKRDQCVRLDNEVSSVCRYFGIYPSDDTNEMLVCAYNGQNEDLEATALKAVSCPVSKENCLGCEYLRGVEIPKRRFGSPEKSHAYVRCGSAILSDLNDVK